jgi:hypothetical protein
VTPRQGGPPPENPPAQVLAKFEEGAAAEFDGLAVLHRFSFGGDRVRYTNRLLRSSTYL